MKVLIVEDTRTNLLIFTKQISSMGHEVVSATNGQEAIEVFQREKPDLVLMDVMMPVMDGLDATREIRKISGTQGWVPIIFLTAMQKDGDLVRGIEVGGDDYLTKPISSIVLKSKVIAMERIAQMRNDLIEVTDKLQDANKELERLSIEDALTGISNRRRFNDLFEMEWKRARRDKSLLSVILLDIDFFKPFNDNYGHVAGDECLKKVAVALKSVMKRPVEFVARYGGEEFVALLPETSLDGAKIVAEALRKSVEEVNVPHDFSQATNHVTVSLGIATDIPTTDMTPAQFLNRADEALYQAKESGRNRWVVCPKSLSK